MCAQCRTLPNFGARCSERRINFISRVRPTSYIAADSSIFPYIASVQSWKLKKQKTKVIIINPLDLGYFSEARRTRERVDL